MSKKGVALAERRERLIDQAARQRVALRRDIEPWRVPLALADQGIIAVRFVRHHPQWVVGVVFLLIAARPAGAWKWLQRGLISWQIVRQLGATNSVTSGGAPRSRQHKRSARSHKTPSKMQ